MNSERPPRTTAEETSRRLPLWPVAFATVGIGLYGRAPWSRSIPLAIPALLVFWLTPYVFPACRPKRSTPISPLVWALVLFSISMVICPLLVAWFGPYQSVLPSLPSSRSMNLALALTILAFISFCIAYQFTYRRARTRLPNRARTPWRWGSDPKALIVAYLLIGFLGIFLSFGSLGQLNTYFTSPSVTRQPTPIGSATLGQLAGLLFRPFLGFGLIWIWCQWLDEHGESHRLAAALSVPVILLLAALTYGTFGYNRGAFAVPLVAIAAVYSRRIHRLSLVRIAAFGTLGLVLLNTAGVYRGSDLTASQLVARQGLTVVQTKTDLNNEFQVYGNGPQFLGFVLTKNAGSPPFLGRTLISAALSPVPVLGKSFRPNSGVGIYNRWIYGAVGTVDQVVPFTGELFMDFGIVGVVAGFLVLGALIAWMQSNFERSDTALGLYVTQYTSMWVSFLIIGSFEVVSQIFVYFFWPIYILIGWEALRRRPIDRIVSDPRLRSRAAEAL